jgi:F0F1-type ATP synthase epsilon subunit
MLRVVDKNKKENFFPINSGFLEVKPGNEVRCIVEE